MHPYTHALCATTMARSRRIQKVYQFFHLMHCQHSLVEQEALRAERPAGVGVAEGVSMLASVDAVYDLHVFCKRYADCTVS